jgi:hypothetical protein
MLLRRRRAAQADPAPERDVVVEHGPSTAKALPMIIGSILIAYGLTSLLKNSVFPNAGANFPNGSPQGTSWLGIEVNGWTSFFNIAAGGLLLFGIAQHHLAKTMSLLVGLALGACAIIALISDNVLGLAAANGWTELGWGIAAVLLVLNILAPRRRRERAVGPAGAGVAGNRIGRFDRRPEPVAQEPATSQAPAATSTRRVD